MTIAKWGALALGVALGSAVACSNADRTNVGHNRAAQEEDDAGDAGDGGVCALPADAVASTFSPNEAASIALVINQGEVAQASLAIQQATSPDVRTFAERMQLDHRAAIDRIQLLVATPASADDPTAAVLARQDLLATQDLQGQAGSAFDFTYVTSQIAAHAKAIAMIERSLAPSVQTAVAAGAAGATELAAELETERAGVSAHLVEALDLQLGLRQADADAGATPEPIEDDAGATTPEVPTPEEPAPPPEDSEPTPNP